MGDRMKNLNFAYLLDFYGGILNDKQREVLTLYYDDDLSLGEIAEISGISRQGAHDLIKRGEAKLTQAEEALGLAERFEKIKSTVLTAERLVKSAECAEKDEIIKLLEELKNQM